MDIRSFFRTTEPSTPPSSPSSSSSPSPPPPPPDEPVDLSLAIHQLRDYYKIGFHAPKCKTLVQTIRDLPSFTSPYQIFLGNPQGSRLSISETELQSGRHCIQETGVSLYVHTPYIINLCAKNEWNVKLLQTNLKYSAQIGCKGVVVHVGKSTKQPLQEALSNMKENILAALDSATRDCPLLLETPAGQGTETLTKQEDFVKFVEDFQDERIRICIDTCHIFACGHNPIAYLSNCLAKEGLVKLVHYNDSLTPCGSCKDRHALVGTGHIGLEMMTEIAELCKAHSVPMVIE